MATHLLTTDEEGRPSGKKSAPLSKQRPRILVVEDQILNLELATDLLESADCHVLQALDGEQALELARSELPDLILMDVSLPRVDGLSVTRQLKSEASTRSIPVVAVTAHALPGFEAKVFEAGCCGFVTKPIDTRTFATTVLSKIEDPGR